MIGTRGDKEILNTFLTNLELYSRGEKKKVDLEINPLLSCWALPVCVFTRMHRPTNLRHYITHIKNKDS